MITSLLDFETQSFSLSHSLFHPHSHSRYSSDLNPRVVLLLQQAAPACHHIRAPLARALEGGQERIWNEICDLITQTQTQIQYQYKMPNFGWSLPPPTIHSRARALVVSALFGCAIIYHYRAGTRRGVRRMGRWGGIQARRFLGRRSRRRGIMPDENIFLSRNEAAARQLRSTSPPTTTTTTKIPNLSTYCSTLSPSAGTRTSPPATRTRRNGPYPNIKGSSSIPNTPVSNTPLCRMQFCEWGIPFLLIDDLVFSALTLWK